MPKKTPTLHHDRYIEVHRQFPHGPGPWVFEDKDGRQFCWIPAGQYHEARAHAVQAARRLGLADLYLSA